MNIWPSLLNLLNISSPVEVATECVVCRSDPEEVELPVNKPTVRCNHPPQVCVQCLQQVILTAINNGDFIAGILCPSLGCPHRLGYYDVQKWATEELFERYDKLILQDSLRTGGSYIFCVAPNCTAGQEHTGGEDNVIVTCHHCGTKQCFRHQVLWHEGLTCDQWDEYQHTVANRQERETENWMQLGAKRCPGRGCGRPIEKDQGCDIMMCKRPAGCGHKFCWECMAPWFLIDREDNSKHYDHCRYYSGLPGGNPAPPELLVANNTQRLQSNVYSPNIRRRDTAMNRESSKWPVPQRVDATSFLADSRNRDMRQRVERLRAEWQASDDMRSGSGSGPGPRSRAYIEQASHWHRRD